MDVSEGGLGVSISSKNELNVWESGSGVVRVCIIMSKFYCYSKYCVIIF